MTTPLSTSSASALPSTGAPPGLFPPDAVVRRVDAEAALLLGGGRALLMQLAHPSVARGVAEHSGFRADPFARLRRTLAASYTIVFGTADEARAAAAGVRAVHRSVVGPGYRAEDPELLLWVHATLVDTALAVHARFLRPLTADEAGRYYEESAVVAELLGLPRDAQPADLGAFGRYVRSAVAGLEVTDEARRLARDVLHPRVPLPAEPALALARHLTVGLLPASLRRAYGLAWDPARAVALEAAAATCRRVLPRLPAVLRRVPVSLVV